jgi:hypothetical protein
LAEVKKINKNKIKIGNRIGSVMVSMLASSAIDCGYELRSCQTKEYKIGICCFHDHSVEGDLANANSAQTFLYFFLLNILKDNKKI